MAVTTAIVGSAVVGSAASIYGSKKASKATSQGAAAAADASVEATRLQIDELSRQFDAQMAMLQPLIQNQYGAGSAFARMLGFDQTDEAGNVASPLFDRSTPFVDPNLDPTQLGAPSAMDTELGQHAFQNVLAPMDQSQDLAIRRAEDVRLAAPTMAEDPRFRFASDTAVVGEEFQTSPGYEFAIEQAQRELDRRQSTYGAYGGRAMLEAQRRIRGEADQEYYNWVTARHADLARQDAAAAAYQNLAAGDVGRGDAAVDNYLTRRAGDLTRQEGAIRTNLGMQEFDLRRGDTAYYNYLTNLAGAAGLGTGVSDAVGASGAYGANAANVYGAHGANMGNIFTRQGENRANIALGTAANINDIAQGSISNWMLARALGS
ncbi:MAG: hypothetical protein MJA83_01490 [Gammaproteobacteria bacterium]|nr:hypothetical protein [Gammaproteobacteria bacterium]